ncbi:MAG: hypothetical protein SGPRY_000473 [Prymnesium sp.]
MAALYPPADSLVLRETIECELHRDPPSSPFSPLHPIFPLSSTEGGRAGVPNGGRDTGGYEPSWSPQDERVAREGEREQRAWQDGGEGRQVDGDGRREGGLRRYGDAGGAAKELSRGGEVVEGTETSGEAAKREGEGDWVGGDEEEEIPSWLVEAAEHLERLVSLEELQGEGETSPIAQAIKFMGVAAAGLPEARERRSGKSHSLQLRRRVGQRHKQAHLPRHGAIRCRITAYGESSSGSKYGPVRRQRGAKLSHPLPLALHLLEWTSRQGERRWFGPGVCGSSSISWPGWIWRIGQGN